MTIRIPQILKYLKYKAIAKESLGQASSGNNNLPLRYFYFLKTQQKVGFHKNGKLDSFAYGLMKWSIE